MTGGAEDEFERLLKYFSSFPDIYEIHGLFPKGERSLIYSKYCTRYSYYKYGHLPVTNDGLLLYLKYILKSVFQIFQVFKFSIGQKYDLAIINVVVLIWPIIALKILSIKVIVFVREDIYPVWLRYFIYKIYGRLTDYIIPNSDTKLNDIRSITKSNKINRIYPAIEDIEICEAEVLKKKIGIVNFTKLNDNSSFKFLNPARILNKKNQMLLLNALSAIKESGKEKVPLLVFLGYYDKNAGYGKQVFEYIVQNSLEEHVMFLGELERKYLYSVYQHVDSVIMSSLSEGMPVVLVEAFKFGKPFISTKVGGIPEVVEHEKTGLLVEFSPIDVAEKMIQIMNNEALRITIKKNASKFYESNFELNQILLQTECIFNKMISQ